ncbi:MAG TPA: DUF4234 domain-containing protein, partial [Solirubrobacteraceae bacterium]|nr:DUF4234 domain-containing protein [Solirubrobacteraceae bacterium]
MAYGDVFTPAGSAEPVKIRGPVWAGLWSFFTIGIYGVYWMYVTAKHLRDYGNAKGRDLGQSPGMTLLAITLGSLIIVPAVVAIYRQAKRIQQAQHLAGAQPMNGWIALVLFLVFSPVMYAYEQSELNKAWGGEGGPVPAPDTYEAPSLPSAPQAPVAPSAPAT